MKKQIWDYFHSNVDYPKNMVHFPIPYGTMWAYISSTYLNGFINYVRPISVFVLDRYTPKDEDITDRKNNLYDAGGYKKYYNFVGTKGELIDKVVKETVKFTHTNLDCFGDDIIILAEVDNDETDCLGRYIFFWFDYDVSDCCIGKFETVDTVEQVKESVLNWLNHNKEINKHYKIDGILDNGILDYTELPLSFLNGWLKF